MVIAGLLPAVSALTVAVVLGIVAGNVPGFPASARAGVAWSTKKLLRSGVVLLGLQLSVTQVLGLGAGTVVSVLLIVALTFAGTLLLGRLLGISRGLSMLVATGFSICGASAVAAMESVVERDDEDVATSVAMVTVFGTISMLGLPVLFEAWGLSAEQVGRIAGGSVHEVAQVVAAASPVGAAAVAIAVVVKLSRVVLLAPMVALVSLLERRRHVGGGKRPPIMPLFVLGFLVAVAVRTTGVLPEAVLDGAKQLTTVLLTGALFALGFGVRIKALLRNGPKAFVLGACSTLLVTALGVVTTLTLA
ncbi:putative sulfate exporter family transporter [Saccharopolyspora oryzae]|uniref:Sulfate exporter family transporter n=1 Tax=Saccharopolyspora oryzae TaxID=2997343 RepID=A0ABT4V9P3_9PSEU|nr:putative sulfate exporter family transporter [Saccharopolyspora oryzae]MDA3630670.1 putative sulfate exporter family transporter [Saccharopolyspora oryzae]